MRTFSLSSAARLNSWSTGSSALKNSDQPTSGAGGLAERVTAMRFDHNIATDGLFVNAQRFSTRPYTPAVEAVSCIGCASDARFDATTLPMDADQSARNADSSRLKRDAPGYPFRLAVGRRRLAPTRRPRVGAQEGIGGGLG